MNAPLMQARGGALAPLRANDRNPSAIITVNRISVTICPMPTCAAEKLTFNSVSRIASADCCTAKALAGTQVSSEDTDYAGQNL